MLLFIPDGIHIADGYGREVDVLQTPRPILHVHFDCILTKVGKSDVQEIDKVDEEAEDDKKPEGLLEGEASLALALVSYKDPAV